MPRFFVLMICVAVVVQGRPRHHKHKKARAVIHVNEDPAQQAYQQATNDQTATGPSQNLNVYNVGVEKTGKNNKVTGQLNAHSVAVSMQGPGRISLTATQQQVAPGDEKPDHTISVMKNTQGAQGIHTMNIHSGHSLPVVLPLSEPQTPQAAPKQAEHHDLKPASQPQQPAKVHTKRLLKTVSHEQQHSPIAHAQEKAEEQQASHEPLVHVHHKVNKEIASKVLTNLESSIPVVHHEPKHEEQVINGHKIKVTDEGEPQKVLGQVDSNNVALTVQGPGSASVTSHLPESSHSIIFDPKPYDLCPGKKCPQSNGGKGTKK